MTRVVLPLTVEEYQVGQLYSVAMASQNETGGGEGVEVLRNEPFTDHPLLNGRYSSGQYTYKIYHLQSKVPGFIRLLAPKGSLEIHEEAWNAYPYCRTIISSPVCFACVSQNPGYMKENFVLMIETLHLDDAGDKSNVHELSQDKLRQREVVLIDIANDPVLQADYKPKEDPTKFKSAKTGRGPLIGKWMDGHLVLEMDVDMLVESENDDGNVELQLVENYEEFLSVDNELQCYDENEDYDAAIVARIAAKHMTASEDQESDDDAPNELVQVTTQDARKCIETLRR
ncbi:unnamed protein product [Darwinula stevensoni]|uniref:Phosphatidylinositol transfer protein N-terminal domain-containing protein n=1 Tax=Darwinula stevensoni TaxID=69355 RepID=A0A7R8XEC4_9CRUS|nr:unnamed protein product [Darwinula stevensoni]CAG0893887.1 unnamed protein product [Darwinula stevensoni]